MPNTNSRQIVRKMTAVLFVFALAVASGVSTVADEGPSEEDVAEPTFFIDTSDGGDDPWRGGCHWHYRDKVCSAAKMFFSGDTCDGNILYEWTDETCHEAKDDKQRYDCAAECKERGTTGTCVTLRDHCGDGMDSAVCECREEGS